VVISVRCFTQRLQQHPIIIIVIVIIVVTFSKVLHNIKKIITTTILSLVQT